LRLAYIHIASGEVGGGGRYYHATAALVADRKGFIDPKPYLLTGQVVARAVALGFSCGLLAITHAEQLLLIGVLLIPLILLAREVPRRRRVGWALLATTAAVAVDAGLRRVFSTGGSTPDLGDEPSPPE
jgi:hypothetical protein